ncbi:MAG: HAD hydrolase family protein, partial [Methermicoccaceae archaeon]
MTLDQIIEYTNLPRESALLARQRDYDEPFIVEPEECKSKVMEAVRESGFDIVAGGDFLHLTKGCDKGKATTILIHMYHQLEKDVMTIGIGDAENDVPMLSAVDMPVFVGGSNISSLQGLQDVPNLIRTSALGPDGFSEAIEMILEM